MRKIKKKKAGVGEALSGQLNNKASLSFSHLGSKATGEGNGLEEKNQK